MKKNRFIFSIIISTFSIGIVTYITNKKIETLDQKNQNNTTIKLTTTSTLGPHILKVKDLNNKKTKINIEKKGLNKVSSKTTKMTIQKFEKYIETTLLHYPNKKEMSEIATAEELHSIPQAISSYGTRLGIIKENVKKGDPRYTKVATAFYSICSHNDTGLTSIRSLCLANLIDIKDDVDLYRYPTSVLHLANNILDL